MQNKTGYIEIKPESSFAPILSEPVALVWFDVDWSGTAQHTRGRLLSFFERHNVQIPVFRLDCSQQDLTFVESWLKEHNTSQFDYLNLCFGGNGEIALVKKGKIVEYVYRPNLLSDKAFEYKIKEMDGNAST